MNRQFVKIGHRGASGYKPENTISSFEKAIELGVDMIELDVHLCRTGELVVLHDEKLNRTTNGGGFVYDKSYEEISRLDAGNGERVPLLKEVVDLVAKRVKINIELKGRGVCKPALTAIKKYVKETGWRLEDFLISSFDHNVLRLSRKIDPDVRIGVFFTKHGLHTFAFAEELFAYSIHPSVEVVDREIVVEARKRGMKTFAWTGNDEEEIKRLKLLGVDGIFSDYPDKL